MLLYSILFYSILLYYFVKGDGPGPPDAGPRPAPERRAEASKIINSVCIIHNVYIYIYIYTYVYVYK